jgi:radical SAM superfamily enzyme YgiQ (UPF0313 family)
MARDACTVLLVMAPGGFVPYFPEHLGTAYLRAILRRAGIPSLQYLPASNPALAGFADALRELRPRAVGFTVYESNLGLTRSMARAVRETLPGASILVGGPNATFSPEETLDLVEADVCLRGAGENAIVPLVEALRAAGPATILADVLGHIPNLVIRTPDGPRRTPPGDLSSLPGGRFRTLDDIPSPFQDGVVSTPDIGYLSARGCNQHCTYCSFAAISGRRVAFHSVERVLSDLEALESLARRVPPRSEVIQICDDAFTLVPDRTRQICEGILERGIRLPLWCETRGDRASPDLFRLMRRAGFVSISFGLESAVPRVLRAIGKVRPPDSAGDPECGAEAEYLERFREAVRAAQGCGLAVNVSVIGGLPTETADDFRVTLDFVASLGVKTYSHNVLGLYPGTPLHERRLEFGLDAFRDPSTTAWRTIHSYAADEVEPLAHSTVHRVKWGAAQTLADALCGRPGEMDAADNSAWAVIVHGGIRSRKLAAWLRRTLAIGGCVVAFVPSRAAAVRWRTFLTQSRVPFGSLNCLVPDASAEPSSFDVLGAIGAPRVRFVPACSPEVAEAPLEVNGRGDCRMSIWVASAPGARFSGLPARKGILAGPGLQVADSCRLWKGSPRCWQPRVLHVDSGGGVRACWHGPRIGAVGDDLGELVRRSRAIGRPPRCPLARLRWMNRNRSSRLWDLDLASQMSWLFPRGNGASTGAGS